MPVFGRPAICRAAFFGCAGRRNRARFSRLNAVRDGLAGLWGATARASDWEKGSVPKMARSRPLRKRRACSRPTPMGAVAAAFSSISTKPNSEPRAGGRFRWILSTCLAATVGAIAILVVVYGSSDNDHCSDGLLSRPQEHRRRGAYSASALTPKNAGRPQMDHAQIGSSAADDRRLSTAISSTNHPRAAATAANTSRQKPYARIVARLAPYPATRKEEIPPFNPFKLYSSPQPPEAGENAGERLVPIGRVDKGRRTPRRHLAGRGWPGTRHPGGPGHRRASAPGSGSSELSEMAQAPRSTA